MKLRDYQRKLVEEITAEGSGSVLCIAPTGAGKTVIMADLARSEPSTIVVCPWRTLVDQTVAALRSHGVECSPLMAGRDGGDGVKVASLETAARRDLPRFARVLLDECHRADTPARIALVDQLRAPGGQVVGMTGTAWNERGPLSGYDSIVIGPSPAELIDRGLLRRPRYTSGGAADMFARIGPAAQAVIYCDSVAESRALAASNPQIAHIAGSTPGAERLRLMEAFRAGEIRAFSNCAVLTEGFDASIDGVALRPGGMNLRLFVQAVGRGIRPGAGDCWVSDPGGLVRLYGCPTRLPWPLWSPFTGADRPRELVACRECREIITNLNDHACEVTPAEPQIRRVALECGLGSEWEARAWHDFAGLPWEAGRERVRLEIEASGAGPAEIAARLRRVGL